MSTSIIDEDLTLAKMVAQLGDIPLHRIRCKPAPGTATEADVIRIEEKENRLFELVDAVLVEKAVGFRESLIAMVLGKLLLDYVQPRNLGLVTGADGMMRLFEGSVRIPDVAFIAWERFPDGKVPEFPIPPVAPNLAIEVLSPSNTAAEMERKRREYFEAGVQLAWMVDIRSREIAVYDSPNSVTVFKENESIGAAPVLPEFRLVLKTLFAELDRKAD